MRIAYKRVVCADGFSMSVQASEGSYCNPRTDDAIRYDAVEVGYPSEEESLIIQFAENKEEPTATVYGWVPSEVVSLVLAKHGGMVDGEVPPGVPELRKVDE